MSDSDNINCVLFCFVCVRGDERRTAVAFSQQAWPAKRMDGWIGKPLIYQSQPDAANEYGSGLGHDERTDNKVVVFKETNQ